MNQMFFQRHFAIAAICMAIVSEDSLLEASNIVIHPDFVYTSASQYAYLLTQSSNGDSDEAVGYAEDFGDKLHSSTATPIVSYGSKIGGDAYATISAHDNVLTASTGANAYLAHGNEHNIASGAAGIQFTLTEDASFTITQTAQIVANAVWSYAESRATIADLSSGLVLYNGLFDGNGLTVYSGMLHAGQSYVFSVESRGVTFGDALRFDHIPDGALVGPVSSLGVATLTVVPLSASAVPEPSSMALICLGGASWSFYTYCRYKRRMTS